ncbi:hypothetical protein Droror1_Dr00006354 [Drosera rotundifolia]
MDLQPFIHDFLYLTLALICGARQTLDQTRKTVYSFNSTPISLILPTSPTTSSYLLLPATTFILSNAFHKYTPPRSPPSSNTLFASSTIPQDANMVINFALKNWTGKADSLWVCDEGFGVRLLAFRPPLRTLSWKGIAGPPLLWWCEFQGLGF